MTRGLARVRAILAGRILAGVVVAGAALGGTLAGGWRGLDAAGRTVWDGVYTAAQAERGQAIYAERCSGCHGDFLDGDGAGGRGPALTGTTFDENWEAASLNDLFVKIGRTMPQAAPGTLSRRDTSDVMAFLLQSNGFPAGVTELTEAPELALVDIVGKDGPRPLRIGSGVRAVGCLTKAGDAWALARASAPVRTRNPAASVGADVDRARTTPLGARTITLTRAQPGADAAAGAKVEVRGVLSALGEQDGITVMSVQTVAPACD